MKSMWGRIVSGIVILVIVAAAAWALWPRPAEVEVATIATRALQVTVEEEGTSRIREVFRVSAPIGGSLTRVAVHSGDVVAEGQTVASIRPAGPGLLDDRSRRIAEATIAAAVAAVDLATTSLAQAEAQQSFAASELDRTLSLAAQGLVSTRVEQQTMLAASTAKSNVKAAEATLLIRQQELQRAEAALIEGEGGSEATVCCVEVRAPSSGKVLSVETESEQVVQPGTPLLEIGDPADLEVIVDVLSSDAVRIAVGADATIEGWGGGPLAARVASVEPVATTRISALGIEEQRTRVTLAFTGDPGSRTQLGHGFHVVARIVIWEAQDLITVPMGALFRRGDEWAVFVVEDGVAVSRTIILGERNADYAEVKGGLALGDITIIHPGDTIADGVRVAAEAG
jgi:HlyD family secretion protein